MHTRSLTLLSILALGFIALPAPSVHACSCIAPGPVPEEVEKTDVIFMGEVTAVTEESDTSFRVTFDLERKWKGLASQETIDIWTPHDSAQCGYAFKIGESYVVYASEDMRVNLCSSTKQKSEAAEDIAYLEAITQDASVISFPDVPSVHVNAEAIAYLKNTGMVHGHPDGTFRPNDKINRAEFVKIVTGRQINSEQERNACVTSERNKGMTTVFFPDVSIDAWHAEYVCVAKTRMIIGGYPDGTFRPGDSISFVEAAKILVTLFVGEMEESDVWYEPFVTRLGELGAIPTTVVRLDQKITRGEMAEMMFRLKAGMTDRPSRTFADF